MDLMLMGVGVVVPINQSTNLPIYQSTNQPINESTNLPTYHSTNGGGNRNGLVAF